MDFVEGKSLAELGRHGLMALVRAANYVKTIANAMHYAHGKGILHRDLKPSNILIDHGDQPRITDFGLASSPRQPQTNRHRTGTGHTRLHVS